MKSYSEQQQDFSHLDRIDLIGGNGRLELIGLGPYFFRCVRVRFVRTEDTQSPNYVKPVPGLSLSGPHLSWWFHYGTHILHLDREIVSISLSISLSWVSRLDGFVPWLFEAFLRSALVRCSWPKVELEPPRAKMCGNNWQRLFLSCWHEPQTSCWL